MEESAGRVDRSEGIVLLVVLGLREGPPCAFIINPLPSGSL